MMRIATFTACLAVATSLQATANADVNPAVLEAQKRRVETIDRVAKSVVAIFAPGGQGGGSGVLISADGYVLSNFHVTQLRSYMQCGLNDGVLYDAVLVGVDPTGDVAVIKLLGRDDFPFSPLGDSDTVQVGDWAYAMGNPFLLATDFKPTVTCGIVSGVHRYQYPAGQNFLEYGDCIQIDTSINPGNSGGPLFNEAGEVIGINGRGSFEKRGRVNSGAGYAISINQIKHFLDHLKSGRIVDHATLGATVFTRDDGAVVVGNILEESEAFRRGLRIDDEIVSFAGRPVRSVNQYKNVLSIYPKGWRLPLVYRREGEKYEVFPRLRALHLKSELTPKQRGPRMPVPRPKPEDKPKDDEKPKGDGNEKKKDGDQKDDKKPQPSPDPHAELLKGMQLPEKYKHLYVKKEGYANYYFNQQNQDRLLKVIGELGDFSEIAGVWRISGKTELNQSFTFTLSDKGLGLEVGPNAYFQALDDSELLSEPPGSGGLLVAMYHFRLLLTAGKDAFTECYYLGSEPLDGQGPRADVLVTTLTGVETRWYFSQETPELLGFDTRLNEDMDECVVRIAEYQTAEGRQFPKVFNVFHAGEKFAGYLAEQIELAPGKVAKPEKKKDDEEDKSADGGEKKDDSKKPE